MVYVAGTPIAGIGATAVMDAWGFASKPRLGIASPDYGLAGHWLVRMTRGRFRHESIAVAAPVHGEQLIGWAAHYLTGIVFTATLPGIWGVAWLQHPTLGPVLTVGIVTAAAPRLPMQPGLGAGIAASRTTAPGGRA